MKKILATILGILLLFFTSLYLPSYALQYQDFQDTNQIHYKKSPDISIYKSKEENEDMLNRMNSLLENGREQQSLMLSYELSSTQQQQLLNNVIEELKHYISMPSLEDTMTGLIDFNQEKTLTKYEMYTIYGENIYFLNLQISIDDEYQNRLSLCVHPDSYKIYSLTIKNSYLASYPTEKLDSLYQYSSSDYDASYNLSLYDKETYYSGYSTDKAYDGSYYDSIYQQETALKDYYETDLDIWYEESQGNLISYYIGSLKWTISFSLEQVKPNDMPSPYLVIGITSF